MSQEQIVLPGLQETAAFDANRRNAFARVPFPQYWGVDPAKFNEVTAADEEIIDPLAIRGGLYKDRAKHANDGLVLLPSEYAVIPLSVQAFARRVGARALGSRVHLEGVRDNTTGIDTRAVAHAFESYIPKLDAFTAKYDLVIGSMRWLKQEIPRHWLAHTNEADMRIRVSSARLYFEEAIDAVAASEDWSADKLTAARLAHEKKLLAGTLDEKKTYWLGFVALTGNWSLSKRALVRNKKSQMEKHIERAA